MNCTHLTQAIQSGPHTTNNNENCFPALTGVAAQDANALAHLQDLSEHPRLAVQQSRFEDFDYPQADLISACSSLFFCPPQAFEQTWRKIVSALRPGGVFCGHFMGPEDSWAQLERGDLSIHSAEQVEQLFSGFDVLDWHEHNQSGQTLLGRSKHWHTWSVLARKKVFRHHP